MPDGTDDGDNEYNQSVFAGQNRKRGVFPDRKRSSADSVGRFLFRHIQGKTFEKSDNRFNRGLGGYRVVVHIVVAERCLRAEYVTKHLQFVFVF